MWCWKYMRTKRMSGIDMKWWNMLRRTYSRCLMHHRGRIRIYISRHWNIGWLRIRMGMEMEVRWTRKMMKWMCMRLPMGFLNWKRNRLCHRPNDQERETRWMRMFQLRFQQGNEGNWRNNWEHLQCWWRRIFLSLLIWLFNEYVVRSVTTFRIFKRRISKMSTSAWSA